MQIGARRRRLLIATATTKSQNASGGVAAWHAGVTCNGRATGHISSLNVYTPWHMNASPPWRFADESSTLTTDSRTDTANCILMANEPHAGTQNHSSPACPRRAGLQSSRGAGGGGGRARPRNQHPGIPAYAAIWGCSASCACACACLPAQSAPKYPCVYNAFYEASAQHRPINGPVWAIQIGPRAAQDRPGTTRLRQCQY